MTKIILFGILLLVIMFLAIVVAVANWNKEVSLTKQQIAQIKESGNVDEISISTSAIECDDTDCWAKIYQQDVIQTDWRGKKSNCSNWDEVKEECLQWIDYTEEELKTHLKDYIEKKLSDWADAEIQRKADREATEEKTGEGTITAKESIK